MKYLKKFNEELRPQTYLSAARKLDKLGHTDRAEELKDWAGQIEKKEELRKWKDVLQDYISFGTYKINVSNTPKSRDKKIVGDFALYIQFDEMAFEDSYAYERDENPQHIKGVSFPFFIGIIPTSEELIRQCEEVMPSPEFGNGFYWGMFASIDIEIINEKVILKKFELGEYDTSMTGFVSFADRTSAHKFKTLFKSFFNNPEFIYPSGYSDTPTMYQKLEQVILVGNSFSSDYGFELKSVADFINLKSPNTMYRTL